MMEKPKRPRRQKKGDRLLNPDASAKQIECDFGVAPLDRLAIEMDRRWGIDRLPELVSPETAKKYGFSIGKLNEALRVDDPEQATAWAGVCIRGLHAMDAEATQLGHQPATGDFWEAEVDGFKFGVLRDPHEWKTAQDARPDLTFYTLREVGLALRALGDMDFNAKAKALFPGSEIQAVRKRTPPKGSSVLPDGDFIPF
jgi:hypothetical protein